ncbi:MAG: hypothetical protein ACU0BB_06620 [Paracoccaceae bacterium]
MIRVAVVLSLLAAPAWAADKKEDACKYESQVMAAVQQAREDRVAQDKVAEHIAATDPSWPAQYSKAIPELANFIYAQKKRDLRKTDFGAIWQEQCLVTWDQRQEMLKNIQN